MSPGTGTDARPAAEGVNLAMTAITFLVWVGNLLLCLGIWEIGNRRRVAHLYSAAGELAWIIKSLYGGLYDLAFMCVVFLVLALRCWFKWGE
jgi:hypothetical protein